MPKYPELATLVRRQLGQLGLTQQRAAEMYGHTRAAINAYATGRDRPEESRVPRLARVLELPLDVLRVACGYEVVGDQRTPAAPHARRFEALFSGLSDVDREVLLSTAAVLADQLRRARDR